MPDSVRGNAPIVVHPLDTEPLYFIFEDTLQTGVTISSAEITVSPDGELEFGSVSVNNAQFNDRPNGLGNTVAIGKAAYASPSGQVAGKNYRVTVAATLSDSSVKAGVFDVYCRDE